MISESLKINTTLTKLDLSGDEIEVKCKIMIMIINMNRKPNWRCIMEGIIWLMRFHESFFFFSVITFILSFF